MESEKALGYVNLDSPASQNNEVEIRVPGDRLGSIRRGTYVIIQSRPNDTIERYLGRIVKGPFYFPDAVSRDSAFVQASVLQADTVRFRPEFHGACIAEVLGEIHDTVNLSLSSSFSRPFPQAAVFPVSNEQIGHMLGLAGDIPFGELVGYPGVTVSFNNQQKSVLPRNVGIFGTVGSGKTNTSQVMIEGASACGWAVVVLDVEGEYVQMDKSNQEATRNPRMRASLERFGIQPRGLSQFSVRHLAGTAPAREEISQEFGLRFSNIDPYVLAEILGFSEAQHDRFLELWHLASHQASQNAGRRANRPRGVAAAVTPESDDDFVMGLDLAGLLSTVDTAIASHTGVGGSTLQVLRRKLQKLRRTGIFDTRDDLGDYSELFRARHVTIFDISNSSSVWINNIVISDLLQGLFRAKLHDRDGRLPPVMVVIEEAHSFVSRENASKMEATLDTLRDISRRGRKRWISLCFISQQPAHLPAEIYELCNTKIVHQTTGGKNLDALKNSAGTVNAAIWDDVPMLGQGKCLVISPQFRHPIL